MEKKSAKKPGLLFLLIGIGLILGGIGSFLYAQQLAATAIEATAEITEITNYHNHDENVTHDVYIRFETEDGQEIRTTLGSYSASMEVGDSVTVLYDPADPEEVLSSAAGITLPLILGCMGLACAAVGISTMAKGARPKE